MRKNDFILLYITNPSNAEARRIAKHILKKRLAACTNILPPTESLYRWKGKLADEKEWILLLKTTKKNAMKAEREIEKIHSYSIPCIIQIPISSNKKYFEWLAGEVVQ